MESKPSIRIANRARAMRRALTGPEAMLWSRLKGRNAGKPVFRRQFGYESMIFDFYCPAARLAVEVDGSTHWSDSKLEQDEARDQWLKRRGITVLRIPASRVYRSLSDVVDGIIMVVHELIARRQSVRRLALSTTRSTPGSRPGSASGPPLPPAAGKE